MLSKNAPILVLLTLIIGFIAYKWPYLELPYYWDELGVYANGAITMAQQKISLAPNALQPHISRGHPLLSYAIFAIPYRIWGITPMVGHLAALSISVTLLISMYLFAKRFYSSWVGVLAVGILSCQALFLVQSGLVLPEVLLTLFSIWALYSIASSRYVLFAITASAALLVKETAIILPVVAICVELVSMLRTKKSLRPSIIKAIGIIAPFATYAIFLIIQKQQNGWYFFDVHTDSIDTSILAIAKKLYNYCSFLFWEQGRYWILPLVLVFTFIKFKTPKQRFNLQAAWHRLLSIDRASLTLLVFFLGILSFSSINFYMARYLLPGIAAMSILLAFIIQKLSKDHKWIMLSALAAVIINASFFTSNGKFSFDEDMSYATEVRTMQKGFDWVEEHVPPTALMWPNFPPMYAMDGARSGYLDSTVYSKISMDQERMSNTPGSYLIRMYMGIDDPEQIDTSRYDEVYSYEEGYARIVIYKNNLQQ